MIDKDKIIEVIERTGPIVPGDINSELKENTMIIGAFLSELVASKKLIISHAKLGGSPVYYLEEQKDQLFEKLYPYLNEKDRKTLDLLKDNQILRDEIQTPLIRTSLRNIPDFAKPFKVTFKGKQLLFWKYYLVNVEDIKEKIKAILDQEFGIPEKETKAETIIEKKEQKENKVNSKHKRESDEEKNKEIDKNETIIENKKIEESKENNNKNNSEKIDTKTKQLHLSEIENNETTKTHIDNNKIDNNNNNIENINNNTSNCQKKSDDLNILEHDSFYQEIKNYFESKNINIISSKLIKKEKEFELELEVPSQVGNIKYFCKAKNKKKSNEGDIAQSFVEGLLKNLPTIYISKGDIPKKLDNILSDKYKNLIVIKI